MPQLLILAAIGAGAYFGSRWIRKKAAQFTRDLEQAKHAARKRQAGKQGQHSSHPPGNQDIADLVKDPKTGVYRVKKD